MLWGCNRCIYWYITHWIQINEVRMLIGPAANKFPCQCCDASILRFLRARNWNTKKAAKMLKETLKWRMKYKPEKIQWVTRLCHFVFPSIWTPFSDKISLKTLMNALSKRSHCESKHVSFQVEDYQMNVCACWLAVWGRYPRKWNFIPPFFLRIYRGENSMWIFGPQFPLDSWNCHKPLVSCQKEMFSEFRAMLLKKLQRGKFTKPTISTNTEGLCLSWDLDSMYRKDH